MPSPRDAARSAARTTASVLSTTIARLLASLVTVLARLHSALAAVLSAGRDLSQAALARGRDAATGPTATGVRGTLRVGLLGRRLDVSLLTALLAPVLALVTAWWVGSTIGFPALADQVVGTWTGRSPHLAVFLAAGVLIGLGGVSAAVNSGLVPTFLLVAGPLFGAGVTRYGRSQTYYGNLEVVSFPEAILGGLAVAVAFGVPLALAGFCLGVCGRRVADVLRGDSGPSARAEQA